MYKRTRGRLVLLTRTTVHTKRRKGGGRGKGAREGVEREGRRKGGRRKEGGGRPGGEKEEGREENNTGERGLVNTGMRWRHTHTHINKQFAPFLPLYSLCSMFRCSAVSFLCFLVPFFPLCLCPQCFYHPSVLCT